MKKSLILSILALLSLPVLAVETVKPGITIQQVINIKGQPYYQTENFAHKTGEQVWLYTKKKEDKKIEEKKIMDTQTNWPTLYRKTVTKTCEIGDIFIEVSQGVVKNVIPANNSISYGPCLIETLEEFLPIVDGKPSQTPNRTTQNSKLE